jgi:hypothetical protein
VARLAAMKCLAAVAALSLATSAAARKTPPAANPEMSAIYAADQADREPDTIDWSVVRPRDEARLARTKALLDSGKLRTGDDYWRAAFVFQHGSNPDDFLVAHTLALLAAAKGRSDATWIAAATLDRYLRNIGQKQIYGTQYVIPPDGNATQEPYDRTLISDALRQALGVPPLSEQEKRRAAFGARWRAANPKPR